jgi:hypothetical protein
VDLTAREASRRRPWRARRGEKALVVAPPEGGWTKGHHYAVAVVGGEGGVKGAGGEPLVASDVWALARSRAALVDCEDLSSGECAPTLTLAPLSAGQAVQLEGLRRELAPCSTPSRRSRPRARGRRGGLDRPGPEAAGASLQPGPDPALAIIPLPLTACCWTTAEGEPAAAGRSRRRGGLRGAEHLDGFSNTAPIVSRTASPAARWTWAGSTRPA